MKRPRLQFVLPTVCAAALVLTAPSFAIRAGDGDKPPLDLIYLNNPEGLLDKGSTVALKAYLVNNSDRAMLASAQLASNDQATVTPDGRLEYWLEPGAKSPTITWTIHVNGLRPTVQPKATVLHYEGDPISSGRPVAASTPLGEGQKVQIEWEGKWWNGEVMAVQGDGKVKIHYTGWDSSWDEAVPRSRLQLAAKTFIAKNVESYRGSDAVGDGECVAFVREAAKVPGHEKWQEGIPVKGNDIPKGTAIATFVDGKYPDKSDGRSMHAAIYVSQDEEGINVWDQFNNPPTPPSPRKIHFKAAGDDGSRSNDGNAFSVIQIEAK